MRWPWVNRLRLEAAEQKVRLVDLENRVLKSEVHHLADVRIDNVKRMARAARQINELTKELEAAKADRDNWRAEYERNT